ncbi:Proteasome subunit alpha type-4, partial [Galemys pyrenaicus]
DIHSLEGHLYQIEYAMEDTGYADNCLGILANNGILLTAEKPDLYKHLVKTFVVKKFMNSARDMAYTILAEIMGDEKPHALEIIALQLCQ